MTNWKKIGISVSKLTLNAFEHPERLLSVSEGDLHAIPVIKAAKYYKDYDYHETYKNTDIFLFKKDNKLLISFYEKDKIENSIYMNHLKVLYHVCAKIFIDVLLYKAFYNSDNISYHFITNHNKLKMRKLSLNEEFLEGDDLVTFSIYTLVHESDEQLKQELLQLQNNINSGGKKK